MKAKTIAVVGAIAGVSFALGGMVLSATWLIGGDAQAVLARPGTLRPFLESHRTGLLLIVAIFGFLGGAAIALLSTTLATHSRPDEEHTGTAFLSLIGGLTGATIAFVVTRAGIGLGGTIEAGVVKLSAFRAVLTFGAAGILAGATIALVTDRLGSPAAIGLEGDAVPESPATFRRESLQAVLFPAGALIIVAAIAFGFSRLFLAGTNALAVTVASVFSVAVLGGGALLAGRPPKSGSDGSDA